LRTSTIAPAIRAISARENCGGGVLEADAELVVADHE